MARIHPTALVEPTAELAEDVEVGAYSIIGAHVAIGAGSRVGPHVVITGRTRFGARNQVFQFASIGEIPQDRKYGGEEKSFHPDTLSLWSLVPQNPLDSPRHPRPLRFATGITCRKMISPFEHEPLDVAARRA